MNNKIIVIILILIGFSLALHFSNKNQARGLDYSEIKTQDQFYYEYSIKSIEWDEVIETPENRPQEANGIIRVLGEMEVFSIDFESESFGTTTPWYFLVEDYQHEVIDDDIVIKGYAYSSDGYEYQWSFTNSKKHQYINKFKLKRTIDSEILILHIKEPESFLQI